MTNGISRLGTHNSLGTPSNSDRRIEKDKARMLHARAAGQPVTVTRWWPGIEQWLYDELMLVPGRDVFVPDPKMTKEQVLVERTRWRNRKRYQQSREGLGLGYRERSKRVSETLADSALRQVGVGAGVGVGVGENPSPAAPTAADKLAGVVLSGVKSAVRTDTRTVTAQSEPSITPVTYKGVPVVLAGPDEDKREFTLIRKLDDFRVKK